MSDLYLDPDFAALYDLQNPWAADSDFYLAFAGLPGASVLDIGCGTGLLTVAIAERAGEVVGVDPSPAMLAIARARPGAERVTFVKAQAAAIELGRRFDRIITAGHAFQHFLSDADEAAYFATLKRHLAPDGRFAFETRNPATRPWERWTPKLSRRTVVHPTLGEVEITLDAADLGGGIVLLETVHHFKATDQKRTGSSRLRFPSSAELLRRLAAAGLEIDRLLGDWDGASFTEASPEIIVVGRLAA